MNTYNPFEGHGNTDTLYNISTGKGTSTEIRDCLLNVPTTGAVHFRLVVLATKRKLDMDGAYLEVPIDCNAFVHG